MYAEFILQGKPMNLGKGDKAGGDQESGKSTRRGII